MPSVNASSSVSVLPGIGKVKQSAYEKLGIKTLSDLLNHYPRAYENRGDIKLLASAEPNTKTALILTIATEPKIVRLRSHKSFLKFRAYDESGTCEITYFNQDYLKTAFPLGAEFRFFGKVEKVGKRYAMSSPVYEEVLPEKDLPPFFPVYRLTEGLTQKQLCKDVSMAQTLLQETEEDYIPLKFLASHSLPSLSFAKRNIHTPSSWGALTRAKKRLIYDEFFCFSLASAFSLKKEKQHTAPICKNNDLTNFYSLLPFPLTNAQKKVIEEIKNDMATDVPMSRMLVGDVGCGKTVCAMASMLIAIQSGRQTALMAPTEILARQHFADIGNLFAKLGIKVELLVGATTGKEKERIKNGLADGSISCVIGTHALLTADVNFKNAGLVITDEQHRFGAEQRAILAEKNMFSHLLVMSATPIPRSLALVLYGDLDISRIDEMPQGRQRVDTFVVDETYRERMQGYIKKVASEGGRTYIVCPAIEENENEGGELSLSQIGETTIYNENTLSLHSVKEYAKNLKEALPELSIAVLHGKMKSAEKDKVMAKFASGEVQVLVSTTVIEVGVNVPEACLMIVENAERFGLSQLHQLRGRVGRGNKKSYCILVKGENTTENALTRLEVMHTTYDGYAIAEKDLAERGPGDFLGAKDSESVRQSGGLRFKLASCAENMQELNEASLDAKELLNEDPELKNNPLLKEKISKLFVTEEGYRN